MSKRVLAPAIALAMILAAPVAHAQIAVSANDNKAALVNGAVTPVKTPKADTITVLDLGFTPARKIAEIPAIASIVGPPGAVAVAPDETYAIVTSAQKIDPANPTKFVPDNQVAVIDLKSSPPKIIQTTTAGAGAAGVAINPAGNLALIANRSDGTVSVFRIAGGQLSPVGSVKLGDGAVAASQPVFTTDGMRALVTLNGAKKVAVLSVVGEKVEMASTIDLDIRPYEIDIRGRGELAVTAGNNDAGQGSIVLIDLKSSPPKVVSTYAAGVTPEGVKMSPNGLFIAATIQNGTNRAKGQPGYNEHGLLKLFRVDGQRIYPVAQEEIGKWCQGAAWSRDSRNIVVQCGVEKEILAFWFDGVAAMSPMGAIKTDGAPGAIRTSMR